MSSPKVTKEPLRAEWKMAERVTDTCLDRGLIVFPGHGTVDGALGDHLLIGKSLVITPNQVRELLGILTEAVHAVEKETPP